MWAIATPSSTGVVLSESAESSATTPPRRRSLLARSWSLRSSFALLLALFSVAVLTGVIYVHVQTQRDALRQGRHDARYSASVAAKQLGSELATVRASVAALGANPQLGAVFAHPQGCTLSFAPMGAGGRDHLDLVSNAGAIACSSGKTDIGRSPSYAGQPWLARARHERLLLAPVHDPVSGREVALSTAPIPGKGFVLAAVDLEALGPALLALYGGGHPLELLATDQAGRAVLLRSSASRDSIGKPSPLRAVAGRSTEATDLGGKHRLYELASVPGAGWRLWAGADRGAVLATGSRLERNELAILLPIVLVALLVGLFTYRRIARPIRRLSQAVGARAVSPPGRMPSGGPAEIRGLAGALDDLFTAVAHESERARRLAAIVDHSDDAILGTGLDGRITTWNGGAERVFGYTAAEARGQHLSRFVAALAGASSHEPELVERLRRDDSIVHPEVKGTRKDGSELDLSVTLSPVKDEQGVLVGASAIARDTSDQHRLEEQLRQARKMEAIGNLAGGIAHDFNNVLMVIRACGSVLMRRLEGNDQLQHDVREIDGAATRGAALTHQLLAFSRQQVLRPEVTEMNAIVTESVGMLERLLGEHIEVVANLAPDAGSIVVDPGQLNQVILNLGVNARDAMPDGGRLTIKTAKADLDEAYADERVGLQPGPYALLQITDTGVGMDAGTQERAFDPFFTTKETGTGLGLATVHGIVKQSGGHVWLYTEVGHGTTFKLYFPAAVGRVVRPAPRQPVHTLAGSERILLVEDDPTLLTLLAMELRELGYLVHEAANAVEALEVASDDETEIDLLLSDMMMPGMTGRELAGNLVATRPNLKVLFTSGYPADAGLGLGLEQIDAGYIEKPYLPQDLARKVRELFAV